METRMYPFDTFTKHHWNPALESDIFDATQRILERPPGEWHDPSLQKEVALLNDAKTREYLEFLNFQLPNWDAEREGVSAPSTILPYLEFRYELAVHAMDLVRVKAQHEGPFPYDLDELVSQASDMRDAYLARRKLRPHAPTKLL